MLPSSPAVELIAPPAVAKVPAFEYAASEMAVSPFVDTVGAVDFVPIPEAWFSYPEQARDGEL